jgi:hypothetical protein
VIIGYLVTEADAAGTRKRLIGFRVAVRSPGPLLKFDQLLDPRDTRGAESRRFAARREWADAYTRLSSN